MKPTAKQISALAKFTELFRACWMFDGPRGARRLLPRPEREHHADLTRIESLAEQLAAAEHRAPVEEDLRHACTILALGRLKRTQHFTDEDCRTIIDFLIGILDPLNLALAQRRTDPHEAKRQRMIYVLKTHALLGYVVSESLRLYDTKNFEQLPYERFLSLFRHIHARPAAWKPGRWKSGNRESEKAKTVSDFPISSPSAFQEWPDELPSSNNPY